MLLMFTRLLTLAIILSACSTQERFLPLSAPLADRGILFLSSDNPYLGPNIAVSEIAARSALFNKFINHQGAPAAIKIETSYLTGSGIKMFYPETNTYYMAINGGEEWITEGPFQIEAQDSGVISKGINKGSFILSPEQFQKFKENPVDLSDPTPAPSKVVAPQQTPAPTPITAPTVDLKRDIDEPSVGDLIIESDGKGSWAEIAARYTGDPSNAGRIARLNGELPNDMPKPGMKIVIPSYLAISLSSEPTDLSK